MSTDEYEAPAQASAANRFGADAYIGFEAIVGSDSTVSYFAVPTFESVGGRSLADRVVRALAPTLEGSVSLQGMRLPVLRETRMQGRMLTERSAHLDPSPSRHYLES